ncbi:MAG: 4a-hydroxytetrahydrobiopterin dehydratase [Candidatus Velthaea sp.]|jgi:4a-hydroxytetrahydrobiopterin dehydratase
MVPPKTLGDAEIGRDLAGLSNWKRDGDELVRTVQLADFDEAISFVDAVAATASGLNHHPSIAIDWNKVTLRLSSHDAGGITERDFTLARAIDALV